VAEGLAGLASVAAANEEPGLAATLGGAAEHLRESVAARELPLERRVAARYLEPTAEEFGRESWDDVWRRGRDLTIDDALNRALDSRGRA
jgi:hypothetical protein